MSEYGRVQPVTETQAEIIRAKNAKLIRENKKQRHDRAIVISDRKQAKILGMSYEEYIKNMGVN